MPSAKRLSNNSPMNFERLFQVLSIMHPLSEEFKEALKKMMVHLSLPKDYFLLEAPKVSDYAYFIEQGCAVSYTFIRGKKQIERFYGTGSVVVSPKSFFERVPSKEFIQLMEQSEVFHIDYTSLLNIFDLFPEANFLHRKIMNQYYEHCNERVHDLQHLNAPQRYEKIHKSFPRIEQVVPQEYLASYLGIAPQSLSRIKRRRNT